MSEKDKDKNVSSDHDLSGFEHLSDEEKLEVLKATLKVLEEKEKQKQTKPPKKPVIMIEFGGIFHRSGVVNFFMYYALNLVIIYGLVSVFEFGFFRGGLEIPLLFVLCYTLGELFFRHYIMTNHFKIAIKSLGFIFFFGYLTIFYMIERYLFNHSVKFYNETLLVVFTGMFVVIRYGLSYLIKYKLLRQRSW